MRRSSRAAPYELPRSSLPTTEEPPRSSLRDPVGAPGDFPMSSPIAPEELCRISVELRRGGGRRRGEEGGAGVGGRGGAPHELPRSL